MLGEICAVCSVRHGKIFFIEKKGHCAIGKIFFSEKKKSLCHGDIFFFEKKVHCKSVRWQKSVNALPLGQRCLGGDNRAMV